MASFNDILTGNIPDIKPNEIPDNTNTNTNIAINTINMSEYNTHYFKKLQEINNEEPLIILDETSDKFYDMDDAHWGNYRNNKNSDKRIYYLDSKKTYTPLKKLGSYNLKGHQLTSLHYMLNLENQVFKSKKIKYEEDIEIKNNDNIESDEESDCYSELESEPSEIEPLDAEELADYESDEARAAAIEEFEREVAEREDEVQEIRKRNEKKLKDNEEKEKAKEAENKKDDAENAKEEAERNKNKKKIETVQDNYTNVGILCDKVGSGKSYTIMGLLNERKSLNKYFLPTRQFDYGCCNITNKNVNYLDTNLLVVPHGLVDQWDKYLKNSGLNYYVVQKVQDVYSLADDNCVLKKVPQPEENENGKKGKGSKGTKATKSPKTKATISDTTESTKPVKKISITKKKTKKQLEEEAKLKAEEDEKKTKEPQPITFDELKEKYERVYKYLQQRMQEYNQGGGVNFKITQEVRDELERIKEDIKKTKENHEHFKHDMTKKYIDDFTVDESLTMKRLEIIRRDLNKQSHSFPYTNTYWRLGNDLSNYYDNIKSEYQSLIRMRWDKVNKIIHRNKLMNCKLTQNDISEILLYLEQQYGNYRRYLKEELKEYVEGLGSLDKKRAETFDVILVSETLYNQLGIYFLKDKYTVNRLIIDECNTIKIVKMVNIKNVFTWLITSSVRSIITENGWTYVKRDPRHDGIRAYGGGYAREKTVLSTGFILTLLGNLYQNEIENYKLYMMNDPEYVNQATMLPDMITIKVICKNNMNINVLNGLVSDDIMKMLYAGNIEGILTKYDVVSGDETNIISVITQKYRDELKILEYELKVAVENPNYKPINESIGVINKRQAIQDMKSRIANIEERVQNSDGCPICYDIQNDPVITPCCNNKYCFTCMGMALTASGKCPTCRTQISVEKLLVIADMGKMQSEAAKKAMKNREEKAQFSKMKYEDRIKYITENSTELNKYQNLDKILEANNDLPIKKYLLFTEYDGTIDQKIIDILEKYNLKYNKIKGTTASITKQVENYKNGDTNVLLINSRYFGSGLNLQNTTDIIILHKMHTDLEMQAVGRAHRYGRVGSLRVWKLYYENENNGN